MLAAAISPEVGYLTAVALQALGALWLASRPESRRWRPAARARRARRRALDARHPLLVVSLGMTAVALGVLEIAVAAFAEEHATRSDAGWLFALWSVGSLAGGLWYGGRRGACRPTCASSSSPACSPPASCRSRSRARCRCSPRS